MEMILSDFLMFHQIFLSPQVKRSAIISNKQGVYEFPLEWPILGSRLRILGKKGKSGKSQHLLKWWTSAQPQRQNQPKTTEK